MIRRFAPIIGLLAALAPALAHAQTNIDQGKSAAQIFTERLRGLPQGRARACERQESSALTDFLTNITRRAATRRPRWPLTCSAEAAGSPIGAAAAKSRANAEADTPASTEEAKPSKRCRSARPSRDAKPAPSRGGRRTRLQSRKTTPLRAEQPNIADAGAGQPRGRQPRNRRSQRAEAASHRRVAEPAVARASPAAVAPAAAETPPQKPRRLQPASDRRHRPRAGEPRRRCAGAARQYSRLKTDCLRSARVAGSATFQAPRRLRAAP